MNTKSVGATWLLNGRAFRINREIGINTDSVVWHITFEDDGSIAELHPADLFRDKNFVTENFGRSRKSSKP